MKVSPNIYEIGFSSRKDPSSWNSVEISEQELFLKVAEVTSNTNIQLEYVTLLRSNRKNKYDLSPAT